MPFVESDSKPTGDGLGRAKFELLVISLIGLAMLLVFLFLPAAIGSSQANWLDWVTFFVGLGLLTWAILIMGLREMTSTARSDIRSRTITVIVLIIAAILFFAYCYYRLSFIPNQMVDLQTRLDALYFTVSTTLTVGFGDVHASGQLARGVVLIHMIFNVAVLAVGVRLFSTLLRERRTGQRKDH